MLNFYIPDKEKSKSLIQFLSEKNFNYMSEGDFLKSTSGGLVVFSYQTSLNIINKTLDLLSANKKNSAILFLPKCFEKTSFKKKSHETIFYPTPINFFEKKLETFFFQKKINFKDVSLGIGGVIRNTDNEKKTYLTETEFRILNLLLKDKVVSKNNLKTKVLNLKITIDTRSLESHLSRIRKKIKIIEWKVKIISVEQEYIKVS